MNIDDMQMISSILIKTLIDGHADDLECNINSHIQDSYSNDNVINYANEDIFVIK